MAEYIERFVSTPDGPTLFLRDYGRETSLSEMPVICLHGLTRNSADFEGIAPVIASSGRRVLALDVRGRGRSDPDVDPSRYRPDIYVSDVEFIMSHFGIKRAVFVGTSMGGLITMLLAQRQPSKVAGAVLNDVGPVLNPRGLARIISYVGSVGPYPSWDAIVNAIQATQAVAFPRANVAFWWTFARRVAREQEDGTVVFAYDPAIAELFKKAPIGVAPDLMQAFQVLAENPVLIVHGAISDILTAEGIGAMRKVKPDLALIDVPFVGHAPTLEEPAATGAILKFLEKVY